MSFGALHMRLEGTGLRSFTIVGKVPIPHFYLKLEDNYYEFVECFLKYTCTFKLEDNYYEFVECFLKYTFTLHSKTNTTDLWNAA